MNIENNFLKIDPIIAEILNKSLSNKEITINEGIELYNANENDLHIIGLVANELRKKKIGNDVTYIINRNINFTNVCIKQCSFCAFSRDFRKEEGYFLPIEEILKRAKEAHNLGATEVCIQAGLPPNMKSNTYENICRVIKKNIPDIHIHGFSPEEILYGAKMSNVSIYEYLRRLKDAGVDTLPGTSAEILNQKIRDKISPGRITVNEWINVIKNAHRLGIKSTSTMMFGHIEKPIDRIKHIMLIKNIQKETHGFTEFVPLNFIYEESPMYKNNMYNKIKHSISLKNILLTYAISRIILNNYINNIQVSWVKEGKKIAQIILDWGANDFGGTLINESISTAAGSLYGQIMKPKEIRNIIWQCNRNPVQRNTYYNTIKKFKMTDKKYDDKIDKLNNMKKFGSYFELIKIKKFRYKINKIIKK